MYDIKKIENIKTGFTELDSLLVGGLNPGELMVIGGRPLWGQHPWRSVSQKTFCWKKGCRFCGYPFL